MYKNITSLIWNILDVQFKSWLDLSSIGAYGTAPGSDMSKQYEPVLPIEEATDICNAIDKVSLLFAGENSVQKLLTQKIFGVKNQCKLHIYDILGGCREKFWPDTEKLTSYSESASLS